MKYIFILNSRRITRKKNHLYFSPTSPENWIHCFSLSSSPFPLCNEEPGLGCLYIGCIGRSLLCVQGSWTSVNLHRPREHSRWRNSSGMSNTWFVFLRRRPRLFVFVSVVLEGGGELGLRFRGTSGWIMAVGWSKYVGCVSVEIRITWLCVGRSTGKSTRPRFYWSSSLCLFFLFVFFSLSYCLFA